MKYQQIKLLLRRVKKDTFYVYYTLRSYRRENDNKSTSDKVIIGKKDKET